MIPVSRLLRRLRQPRSRADDLRALRRRFADAGAASAEEAAVARRLRAVREELSASFGAPSSCGSCARGKPLPAGRFEGGHCCGGATEDVFTDLEVVALSAGGTRPRHLRPPTTDHAGCAFRGEHGCSLEPAHRPNVCVRYVCRPLSHELYAGGALDRIEALVGEMEQLIVELSRLHAERELDEAWPETA